MNNKIETHILYKTKLCKRNVILFQSATKHSLANSQKENEFYNRNLFEQAVSYQLIELSYANRFKPLLNKNVHKTCFAEKVYTKDDGNSDRSVGAISDVTFGNVANGAKHDQQPNDSFAIAKQSDNGEKNQDKTLYNTLFCKYVVISNRISYYKHFLSLKPSLEWLKELAPQMGHKKASPLFKMWGFAFSSTFFLLSISALVQKQRQGRPFTPFLGSKLPGLNKPCQENSWQSFENITTEYLNRDTSLQLNSFACYKDQCLASFSSPWQKQLRKHFVGVFADEALSSSRSAEETNAPVISSAEETNAPVFSSARLQNWLVLPCYRIQAFSPPRRTDKSSFVSSTKPAAIAAYSRINLGQYKIKRPWIITASNRQTEQSFGQKQDFASLDMHLHWSASPKLCFVNSFGRNKFNAQNQSLYAKTWQKLEKTNDSTPSKLSSFDESLQEADENTNNVDDKLELHEAVPKQKDEKICQTVFLQSQKDKGLKTTETGKKESFKQENKKERQVENASSQNNASATDADKGNKQNKSFQVAEEPVWSPHNLLKDVFYRHGPLIPSPDFLIKPKKEEEGIEIKEEQEELEIKEEQEEANSYAYSFTEYAQALASALHEEDNRVSDSDSSDLDEIDTQAKEFDFQDRANRDESQKQEGTPTFIGDKEDEDYKTEFCTSSKPVLAELRKEFVLEQTLALNNDTTADLNADAGNEDDQESQVTQGNKPYASSFKDLFSEQDNYNFHNVSEETLTTFSPATRKKLELSGLTLPKPNPFSLFLRTYCFLNDSDGSDSSDFEQSSALSVSPFGGAFRALGNDYDHDYHKPYQNNENDHNLNSDDLNQALDPCNDADESQSEWLRSVKEKQNLVRVLDQSNLERVFSPSLQKTDYEPINLSPRFMSGYIFPELNKSAIRAFLQRDQVYRFFTSFLKKQFRNFAIHKGESSDFDVLLDPVSIKKPPSLPACAYMHMYNKPQKELENQVFSRTKASNALQETEPSFIARNLVRPSTFQNNKITNFSSARKKKRMQYRQLKLNERKEIKRLFKKLCSFTPTKKKAAKQLRITGYQNYLSWPKDSSAAIRISPSLEEDQIIAQEGLELELKREQEEKAEKEKAQLAKKKQEQAQADHFKDTSKNPKSSKESRAKGNHSLQASQSFSLSDQEDGEEERLGQQKKDKEEQEKAKKQEEVTRFDYLSRIYEKEERLEKAKKLRRFAFSNKKAFSKLVLSSADAVGTRQDNKNDIPTKQGFVAFNQDNNAVGLFAPHCSDDLGKAAQTKLSFKVVSDRKQSFFGRTNLFPKRLVAKDQKQVNDQVVHHLHDKGDKAFFNFPVYTPDLRLRIKQSELLDLFAPGLSKITHTSKAPPLRRAHRWWQKRRIYSSLLGFPSKRYMAMPNITTDDWKKIVEWQLKTYLFQEEKRLNSLVAKKPSHHFKIKKLFIYLPWVTLKKPVKKFKPSKNLPVHLSPKTPCTQAKNNKTDTNKALPCYTKSSAPTVFLRGLYKTQPCFVTKPIKTEEGFIGETEMLHKLSQTRTKQLVFEWPVTRLDYENRKPPFLNRNDEVIVRKLNKKESIDRTKNMKSLSKKTGVLSLDVQARPFVPNWRFDHYLVSPYSESLYSTNLSYKIGNQHRLQNFVFPDLSAALFTNKSKQENSVYQPFLFEPVTSYSYLLIHQLFFAFVLQRFFLYIYRVLIKRFVKTLKLSSFVVASLSMLFQGFDKSASITRSYKLKKRFKDVGASEDTISASSEIVCYLRNSCRGRAKLRGIILVGAANSETTELLKAIGGEAQATIVVQSLQALILTQSHPQRQLEKALTFAQKKAPALLFLDDLDTIGKSRPGLLQNTNKTVDSIVGSTSASQLSHNLLVASLLATGQSVGYKENRFFATQTSKGKANAKPCFAGGFGAKQSFAERRASRQVPLKQNQYFTAKHTNQDEKAVLGESQLEKGRKQRKTDLMLRLLTVMDGINSLDGVVLATTSQNPSLLDPALLRPGRFEKLVYVKLPSKKRRVQLLQMQTKKIGQTSTIAWDYLSEKTAKMSGAEIASAVNHSAFKAILDKTGHTTYTLEHGINFVKGVPFSANVAQNADKTHLTQLSEDKVPHKTVPESDGLVGNGMAIVMMPNSKNADQVEDLMVDAPGHMPQAPTGQRGKKRDCQLSKSHKLSTSKTRVVVQSTYITKHRHRRATNNTQIAFYQAGKGVLQNVLLDSPKIASLTFPSSAESAWSESVAAEDRNLFDVRKHQKARSHQLLPCTRSNLSTRLIALYAGQAGEAIYLSSAFSKKHENRSSDAITKASMQDAMPISMDNYQKPLLSICQSNLGYLQNLKAASLILKHQSLHKPFYWLRKAPLRTKLCKKFTAIKRANLSLNRITDCAHTFNKTAYNHNFVRSVFFSTEFLNSSNAYRHSFTKSSQGWEDEVCESFSNLNEDSGKWYRLYLSKIDQNKNDKEWLAPDQLSNQRLSLPNHQAKLLSISVKRSLVSLPLKKIADKMGGTAIKSDKQDGYANKTALGASNLRTNKVEVCYNASDLGLLRGDLFYYNNVLTCFYAAFANCLENRELLDVLADHLVRFRILRLHEMNRICSFYLQRTMQCNESP